MADSHSLSFYNSFSSFFPNPLLALFVFVSLFFFFLFRSMTLSFSLSVLVSFQILNLWSCVYVQISATDGCGHGSWPWRGAIANLLLGLLESLPGATLVLEENKGVALGLTRVAVSDRLAILNLAVLAEDGGEGFSYGVPPKAVDEDLVVVGVRIGELTHDFNQVRVLAFSLLD